MCTNEDLMEVETSQLTTEELRASSDALEFLSSIGPSDIEECLFTDSLVTVSDTGEELGEFCVNIEQATYNTEPCYLVHVNSHGATDDGTFCGTSITAYVSRRLEILEEKHHEYMKLQEQGILDRKVHLTTLDDCLVVDRVITENEEVKTETFTFPLQNLQGFVSEASNLLILRILAQHKKVPENMTFLSFDANTQIAVATYSELGTKEQTVGKEMVDVFGIERVISVPSGLTATWHCYFLSDGHLASRLQLDSPVSVILLELPAIFSEDETEQKPVFEKKPLIWEEDMELYSRFLDRKEELKADHSSYIGQHPELKALLADFLQFLLLRKPQQVFDFTRDYFVSLSVCDLPSSTSQDTEVLHDNET